MPSILATSVGNQFPCPPLTTCAINIGHRRGKLILLAACTISNGHKRGKMISQAFPDHARHQYWLQAWEINFPGLPWPATPSILATSVGNKFDWPPGPSIMATSVGNKFPRPSLTTCAINIGCKRGNLIPLAFPGHGCHQYWPQVWEINLIGLLGHQ